MCGEVRRVLRNALPREEWKGANEYPGENGCLGRMGGGR